MSDDEDDVPPHNTADLPTLTREFRNKGAATRTKQTCNECDGLLWNVGHDTVCANCSLVIESLNRPRNRAAPSIIPQSDDRSEHSNSERPRCPGGFPHAYDWGDDPDDHENFYR